MKILDRVPSFQNGALVLRKLSLAEARLAPTKYKLEPFISDPLRARALSEVLQVPILENQEIPKLAEGELFLLVEFQSNAQVAEIYEARLFLGW